MSSTRNLLLEYSLQIISGSLSFIASMTIVLMVIKNGLNKPYRRLIFGLSISDMFQSFALLTGPFATPSGEYSWSVGSIQTCEANGFLMVYGSTAVPLYLLSLSVYYNCKLITKMTDSDIMKRFETWAHIFINLVMFIICILGLVTKSFNSIFGGTICHFAKYPLGCGTYPEIYGECTRGLYSFEFVYVVTIGITSFCFIGMIVTMVLLVRSATKSQRMYASRSSRERSLKSTCCLRSMEQDVDESHADYLFRKYKRETEIQAFLYILSFFLSYTVVLVASIWGMTKKSLLPPAAQIVSAFLYPIMGCFNILIYTRPKVQKFREANLEISWIRSFLLVIKAGGDVPTPSDDPNSLRICTCCRGARQDSVQPTVSERSIFFSSLFRMRTD